MNEPLPPRLVNDPEVGPLLRAEQQTAGDPFQVARVGRRLAEGGSSRARHVRFRWAWVLAGAPLLAGAAAATYAVSRWVSPAPAAPAPRPEVRPAPSVPPVPPKEEEVVPPPEVTAPEPAAVRPEPPRPVKATRASVLAAQVETYRAARKAADAGDFAGALARLDALDRDFPQHALAAEVAQSRAEWLTAAGRYEEASRVLTRALEDPALHGKRPSLLRLLGDLRMRLGERDAACDAYRQALGLGLTGAEADAARSGVRNCAH